jgi:hypothetical protein
MRRRVAGEHAAQGGEEAVGQVPLAAVPVAVVGVEDTGVGLEAGRSQFGARPGARFVEPPGGRDVVERREAHGVAP